MKLARLLIFAVLLATVVAPTPMAAHSLDSLEQDLHEKEKFFEIKNVPAPDFTLQDADDNSVSLSDLRGKIVVLHFVYASCPDVCPLHADVIARIQEMVNQTPMRDQVQVVTVTTDPERDTAEVLRGYGEAHGLDPANWVFLTSGPDRPEATRELVEAFGHGFTVTEDGLQMHGVVTHVIDQQGTLRGNFHGLEFDPTNLVVYLNGLVNAGAPHGDEAAQGTIPSIWQRILSLF
ncbi:SCO family protein [Inquilinus sp. CAU 1745]|uniref:SCO family protein n=1 Tax=Inquilinus sp. CAU 1745 TaxID=3140369 RepID=UPI00325BFDD7